MSSPPTSPILNRSNHPYLPIQNYTCFYLPNPFSPVNPRQTKRTSHIASPFLTKPRRRDLNSLEAKLILYYPNIRANIYTLIFICFGNKIKFRNILHLAFYIPRNNKTASNLSTNITLHRMAIFYPAILIVNTHTTKVACFQFFRNRITYLPYSS